MTKLNYARRLIALVMVTAATSFGMAQAKAISTVASNVQQVGMHELQVDTAGILDYDERDAASNVVLDFYVGSGASITSLKWDVNLTSYVGSYLSEMKLTFSDSLGKGVTFTPAMAMILTEQRITLDFRIWATWDRFLHWVPMAFFASNFMMGSRILRLTSLRVYGTPVR